jgi:hypothetical protein
MMWWHWHVQTVCFIQTPPPKPPVKQQVLPEPYNADLILKEE